MRPFASSMRTPSASHRALSSSSATVARSRPSHIGFSLLCSCGMHFNSAPARNTVEKYGPGSSARPISSAAIAISTRPSPMPPSRSSKMIPVQPVFRELLPEPAVVGAVDLHEAAHLGHGTLGGKELARGILEQLLGFGQSELHQ